MGRSSKQMEIDKPHKFKEEAPHLSGAYIRSLVKQLTSSRTNKDPLNPKDPADTTIDAADGLINTCQNLAKFGQSSANFSETQTSPQQTQQPPPPPPQHHKKQVRRRLHTSRPYQERLLNMAEARREIVTALKFHRAAMKQQANEQHHNQSPTQPPLLQPQQPEQGGKIKSRRNPRIYPSSSSENFSNYLDNNFSYYSSLTYNPPPPPPSNHPFSWPSSFSQTALPSITETYNLALPNQTLGLNLNFHDFNNLDATLYQNNNNPSIYSSSSPSPSSSSSPPLSIAMEEIPLAAAISQEEGPTVMAADSSSSVMTGGGGSGDGLHPAMDDEEIAEIRSIGEQHQMEWNDRMNLVTSAWWFKFLKTTEIGPEEMKVEDDGFNPFDEVMEFPSWLNGNDESCFQQHLNDYCSEEYLQDPALPCMDIGEIEGMDGEWLA